MRVERHFCVGNNFVLADNLNLKILLFFSHLRTANFLSISTNHYLFVMGNLVRRHDLDIWIQKLIFSWYNFPGSSGFLAATSNCVVIYANAQTDFYLIPSKLQ